MIPLNWRSNDSWNKNAEILEISMSWGSKFCFHVTYISSFAIIYFSVDMSSKVRYKTPMQFPY